ncbi:MAG TPA: sugar transferase [Nevskiaceae bacterium]|nr:sugar transferase [Nevskiaceae bacterium]
MDTSLEGKAYLDSRQKQLLDAYGAHVLYAVAAPFLTMARLAVWAEDKGPTLIGLPRIGKDGKTFYQRKIRSMKPGSEHIPAPVGPKVRDDPRITRVGRVVRKFSVDELPQIGNIKRREMSLVGPRPKSPKEYGAYCELDPDFGPAYTLHLPGLTGLEQINGRAGTTVEERIAHTKQYAEEARLPLDLQVICSTAKAVLTANGAY